MAKAKRGKSGSSAEVGNWEIELSQSCLEENEWKPLVIFLGANKHTDNEIVNLLNDTIKSGLRKLFSVISYEKLMVEVREIAQLKGSRGKGAAGTKPPQFAEICDQVRAHLEQGETIPLPMLAKLVKFKLLTIKTKDKERREGEKKLSTNGSKSKMETNNSKSGSPTRARSQSPGKGGKKGGKKEPEKIPSPKKDTKLKKRGEESDIIETIDDEPDGPTDPQHYIILTGFTDASLFSSLVDINITVNAVINLKTDYQKLLEEKRIQALENEQQDENIEGDVVSEETNTQMEEEIEGMWEDIDLLVKHSPTGHSLKDMAKFDVVVQDDCFPEQLTDAMDPKGEFATWLFGKVADVCYDMLGYMKQYRRYLDQLKIINVSVNQEREFIDKKVSSLSDGTVDSVTGDISVNSSEDVTQPPPCDLRYYDKLMSNVPVESETIPIVLDCLLEQVVAVTDGPNPMDQDPPPRQDGLSHLVGDYWDRQFALYGGKDDKKLWKVGKEKKPTPDIVYTGDEKRAKLLSITSKNKHFNAEAIEEHMRTFHPYANFINYLQPCEEEWMENCIRRKQLYNFCRGRKDISEEKFERAMRQYIFESLPLEISIDVPQVEAVDEQLERIVSRWDYPYYDVQQACSDTHLEKEESACEAVGATTPESFCLRNLDCYNWLERFEPQVLHQVLDKGSDMRPYLDTYYNRGNNTLLVVLHNPCNENLENNFQWESWLHSDVGFRNYLEYVAFEIQEWTSEQDEAEEERRKAEQPTEVHNKSPIPPVIKEKSRWGLKTRTEIAQESEVKETVDKGVRKKSAKSRSRSGSPNKEGRKSADKKKSESKVRKSSARQGSRAGTASKRPGSTRSKVSFTEESPQAVLTDSLLEENQNYTFIGYNLGDNLLHVSVDQSYLFPQNGALIKVEKLNYVQQSTTVQITIMYKGDTFSLNFANPIAKDKHVVPNVQPEQTADDEAIIDSSENNKESEIPADQDQNKTHEEEANRLPPLPETPPSICAHSNITASLSDGVLLSFSSVIPRQESEESLKVSKILTKITKELSEVMPAQPTVNAPPKSPKGKKGKRDEDQKQQEEIEKKEAEEAKKVQDRKDEITNILTQQRSVKNLYVTTPNGVHLTFKHGLIINDVEQLEENEETFVLKQELLRNEREEFTLENCDQVKELYRCITSDGLVIKYNSDQTVEILSPYGDVYTSTPYPSPESDQSPTLMSFNDTKPNPEPSSGVSEPRPVNSPTRSKKSNSAQSKAASAPREPTPPVENLVLPADGKDALPVSWDVIAANGERWRVNKNKDEEMLEDLLIADATCYETNQVLQTREDGIMMLHRPDGTQIVEYLDGTRVTTTTLTRTVNVLNQETGESHSEEVYYDAIIIEHDLYPTTTLDSSRSAIQVTCSNGRDIQAFKNGGYIVSRQESEDIVITSNGEVSLYPNHDIVSKDGQIHLPAGLSEQLGNNSCLLKQTPHESVKLIDCHGNKFVIDSDGEYTVEKSGHQNEDGQQILPRYFVVYADGSGEELLRYEDVYDYLTAAEQQPSAAILHGDVEEDVEGTAVTVIKPHKARPTEIWKPKKFESDIIPVSLRERDFRTLPKEEKKLTWLSKKLGLKNKNKEGGPKIPKQAKINCPEALEIRHLLSYKELTNDIRNEIIDGINKYGEYVTKQQDEQENMRNVDERSEEEKLVAQRIKEKYYEKHGMSKDNSSAQMAGKVIADQYIDAITPPRPPSPRRPHPERSAEEWEKDKIELQQCEYEKYIIRTKDFPPYFQTEQGEKFLLENPDMDRYCSNLAQETRRPPMEQVVSSSICSTPSEESSINHQEKISAFSSTPSNMVDMSSSLSINPDISGSSISPFPSSRLEASSNINASDRPLNPTPQKAGNMLSFTRGGLQMADSRLEPIDETRSANYPDEAAQDDENKGTMSKSLYYDVSGSPRKEKVKTPNSILGTRPNAIPNEKFSEIEDPVRRQIKTASVHGAVDPELTAKTRGFVLLPDLLDFGVLTEGYAYCCYPVKLKNVGVDSCRFKIKQPPPSTGLKIIYKPGPVAAGMDVTFEVEIFAVAVGVEGNCGTGIVSHHVEIVTETDIIYLPVVATVVTQHESENPSEMTPRGGPSKGTLVLDKRPSSRETIRPRKD